jgi:hypothetical protein
MQSAKAIAAAFLAGLALSAPASAAEGDLPGLPWQMAGNNHVLVGVVWNDAVLKVIPKGLSATPERTGGINIYYSPRGYGAAPYQSGYGWIDLAGNDAADGSKARFIFRAGVGPTENITKAFRQIWGAGIRSGGTKLESTGEFLEATGVMNGKVWGTVRIKTSDQCQNAAGTLIYFIPSPDGSKLSRMQIPWSSLACGAEPVSAQIDFPDEDLAGVKPEKLLWAAELREGAFGFTQPVIWK